MTKTKLSRFFYKMSGSGNDFVVVDATTEASDWLLEPAMVQAICARGTGVGADGVVLLQPSTLAHFRMTYLNSDGSRADLCGNASLCSTRLALELGIISAENRDFQMQTDSGVLTVRISGAVPEVDLQPVSEVDSAPDIAPEGGERWIGFSVAGVPHLVVRVNDVSIVDVLSRGRMLRHHASLRAGANVNFVSPTGTGDWRIRTFERGVEGETLACGTGAIATAILLNETGEAGECVRLVTRSECTLRVRLAKVMDRWLPSLSGEGRIVFRGELGEVMRTH